MEDAGAAERPATSNRQRLANLAGRFLFVTAKTRGREDRGPRLSGRQLLGTESTIMIIVTRPGTTQAEVDHIRERVEMLGRSGDGVEIQTADGTRGWVTYWFIKELK